VSLENGSRSIYFGSVMCQKEWLFIECYVTYGWSVFWASKVIG
jgi:hypothetical protein